MPRRRRTSDRSLLSVRTEWRKKHKRKRHRKSKRIYREFIRQRFPRLKRQPRIEKGHETDIEVFEKLHELRTEYPPPYYTSWRDGAYDPMEAILCQLVNKLSPSKLKAMCSYHGLSDRGTRFDFIKRLYLHARSSTLSLGYPYAAYGPDHERVEEPQCFCGKVRKNPEKIKRFPREEPKRFARTNRFPRFLRFPRLLRAFYKMNLSGQVYKIESNDQFIKDYTELIRKVADRL